MVDTINIEVLEDGTISVNTEGISEQQHMSADQFLNDLAELSGGKRTTTHKAGHEHHTHKQGTKLHRHGSIVHSH